jgi:hypothetical protein
MNFSPHSPGRMEILFTRGKLCWSEKVSSLRGMLVPASMVGYTICTCLMFYANH